MAESTVSLKLLIDTHGKRVLFAEAGKDFVDFLFGVLSLPVSALVNLIRKHGMEGPLANLYESIETLNDSYIQPNKTKDILLKPMRPPVFDSPLPLLALEDSPTVNKVVYICRCRSQVSYYSDDTRARCSNCLGNMTVGLSYVAPPPAVVQQASTGGEGGFVKGVVTYMVMDDLVVKPMSTISSITLLNRFNIKEVGVLEEKVVNLGMDEAVKLMKASLQSKKVLTDVFLNGINK